MPATRVVNRPGDATRFGSALCEELGIADTDMAEVQREAVCGRDSEDVTRKMFCSRGCLPTSGDGYGDAKRLARTRKTSMSSVFQRP